MPTDEREPSRQRAAEIGGFVAESRIEEYSNRLEQHFAISRRDGIVEVRMHTDDGPAVFGDALHDAWPQAWLSVGSDHDNEILIFTGTGDYWLKGVDPKSFEIPLHERPASVFYELYWNALKLLEAFVFNVNIPTIGAVNGPGFHQETALLCDLTLCTEDTVFFDPHFEGGVAPGDGLGLVLQRLLGLKRAAYYMYTSDPIDAQLALELGLVNEVLPRDRLLPRAWEIAEAIRSQPRAARRFTAEILRRPWKRQLVDDLQLHLAHELLGIKIDEQHQAHAQTVDRVDMSHRRGS